MNAWFPNRAGLQSLEHVELSLALSEGNQTHILHHPSSYLTILHHISPGFTIVYHLSVSEVDSN